jgi:hypothetical protein
VTTTGTKIMAKGIQIDQANIRYKKYDNTDGPDYVLNKNEIEFIS